MKPTFYLLTFLLLWINQLSAQNSLQEELDELNAELDKIFADEVDSLSLTALINQIIKDQHYTEVQLRLGYSNRVTSAGRIFGVDQQGIVPGLTFYHHSGLYLDATGFWTSALNPNFYLTVMTLGYLGKYKKKVTYGLSYDHSFFTEKDSLNTLTNSVSTAVTYNLKHVYSGIDYSYSFGSESANRLIWNLTGNFSIKGFGLIDKITFLPSFALLFGNQNITQQYFNVDKRDKFVGLSDKQIRRWAYVNNLTLAQTRLLINAKNGIKEGTLTSEQSELVNTFFTTTYNENKFSLLNYYITVPIVLTAKQFRLYLSYNYNIPQNISSDVTYEPNGYFGCSLLYRIKVK